MSETEKEPAPPARRQVPIKVMLAGLYLLPALLALFGHVFSAGGGYLCGMMVGALARKYALVADTARFPGIGALAGVVFFLCALAYQFLSRKK